jgi:hypothetical protein
VFVALLLFTFLVKEKYGGTVELAGLSKSGLFEFLPEGKYEQYNKTQSLLY